MYIHGGGFSEGSGNNFFYGPDFLLDEGVIVVTINYRLGTFGFMSLNTRIYSGNMGLKDQQMALKWTHRNIQAFGGDKRRITLMGQSAGMDGFCFEFLVRINTRVHCRCGISSLSCPFGAITKTHSPCYLLEWNCISSLCLFR